MYLVSSKLKPIYFKPFLMYSNWIEMRFETDCFSSWDKPQDKIDDFDLLMEIQVEE